MRQIAIIGAFLAGLAGLCMSVCGGGFFVVLAYNSARNVFQSGRLDQLINMLVLLVVPAGFAVGGAFLFWACFKAIRRRIAEGRENRDETRR
jgi:hypothetical protein